MLKMLGRAEVDSILEEQEGAIQVNCEFCRLPYRFDTQPVAALFAEPQADEKTSVS